MNFSWGMSACLVFFWPCQLDCHSAMPYTCSSSNFGLLVFLAFCQLDCSTRPYACLSSNVLGWSTWRLLKLYFFGLVKFLNWSTTWTATAHTFSLGCELGLELDCHSAMPYTTRSSSNFGLVFFGLDNLRLQHQALFFCSSPNVSGW